MIYLDHAATTSIYPEALDEMVRVAREVPANPSSSHAAGDAAYSLLERCRSTLASHIGCRPREVVFTSGGSESCSLAIVGAAMAQPRRTLVVSSIEHSCVLESARELEKRGFHLKVLGVDGYGRTSPDALADLVDDDTFLVSVMHANNEVGTLQPLQELVVAARRKQPKVLFHTDAVQSFGKVEIPWGGGLDLVSVSAHKVKGPLGVGVLAVRRGTRMTPQIFGGGQEEGLRSGTQNLPAIAGFAKACRINASRRDAYDEKTALQVQHLKARLLEEIPGVQFQGHPEHRIPGIVSLSIPGVKSQHLMTFLDEAGIQVSSGSACHSRRGMSSHVLQAMGIPESLGTIRLSLGTDNVLEDMDRCVDELVAITRRFTRRTGR